MALVVAPTGTRLVVMVPPWSDPGRLMSVITQAGGSLVNGGAMDWIAIVDGDAVGFATRLIEAGAIMVLDGRIAQSCLNLVGY